MSTNLHIEVDGRELEIEQTPTWVTYMCLVDHDGYRTRTGKSAISAMLRYREYIRGRLNGDWNPEDLKEMLQFIHEQVRIINEAISTGKKFKAYMR
jgi:hypothetical protein